MRDTPEPGRRAVAADLPVEGPSVATYRAAADVVGAARTYVEQVAKALKEAK